MGQTIPSVGPGQHVPEQAFHMTLRVRSYEVSEAGHTSPGTMLRYLEHLATRASAALGFDHTWYEQRSAAWVVREMHLLLGTLPSIDDELVAATWISDVRRVQAHREYAVWHAQTHQLVARARGRWAYVDRFRGQPLRIPDELLERMGVLGSPMRSRRQPPAVAPASTLQTAEMSLQARLYEADTQHHINNTVYADWLVEALHRARQVESTPQPPAPLRPRWYAIEYVRPIRRGDQVCIDTSIAPRTRGLTVTQEIVNQADGAVAVRARSEYLNNVAPAP